MIVNPFPIVYAKIQHHVPRTGLRHVDLVSTTMEVKCRKTGVDMTIKFCERQPEIIVPGNMIKEIEQGMNDYVESQL